MGCGKKTRQGRRVVKVGWGWRSSSFFYSTKLISEFQQTSEAGWAW